MNMKTNRTLNKFIFSLTVVFMLSAFSAFSQNQPSKPTRQSALDAFSKGNFELAYRQFNELSASYPKDPLYKYYCGASLVSLERDPAKAVTLLKEALRGTAAIRTIPADGLFFLGRAQQQSGDYTGAINSYTLYSDQAGKKIAKEAMIPQFIQQCNEEKGALAPVKPLEEVKVRKDSIPAVVGQNTLINDNVETKDTTGQSEKPLPEGYEQLINEALDWQFRADSLSMVADKYRQQLDKTQASEKPALKAKITEAEQLAGSSQKKSNEKLVLAASLTNNVTRQTGLKENNIVPDTAMVGKEVITVIIPGTSGVMKDSLNMIPAVKSNAIEVYSVFEVTAKPAPGANEKVPVNKEVPPGLIYRIQVAVFRNPVALSYFKGLAPVYGFRNEGSEVTNYYAGMFRKSADATRALAKVKTTGFKDAFVVALLDKKIVSADRAVILEKEWGSKPFNSFRNISEKPLDTIPPTLIFRVEVIKSQKPLNAVQLDNIKRLAGNRGLDVVKNEKGLNIYLIGKFLTFESAAEYADLLMRNGQKASKVAAYLGSREIPVETAKQLFEKF
jgi:hypothetical protein